MLCDTHTDGDGLGQHDLFDDSAYPRATATCSSRWMQGVCRKRKLHTNSRKLTVNDAAVA